MEGDDPIKEYLDVQEYKNALAAEAEDDAKAEAEMDEAEYGERLKWSPTPPTAPGWYWYEDEICRLCYPNNRGFDGKTLVAKFTDGGTAKVSELVGHWAGPIPLPEEG